MNFYWKDSNTTNANASAPQNKSPPPNEELQSKKATGNAKTIGISGLVQAIIPAASAKSQSLQKTPVNSVVETLCQKVPASIKRPQHEGRHRAAVVCLECFSLPDTFASLRPFHCREVYLGWQVFISSNALNHLDKHFVVTNSSALAIHFIRLVT